jgi:mannitol operon repressor
VDPDDDLNKRCTGLEKFWPYVRILNAESPRGKVLVSVGFLEDQLKQILLAFFVYCSEAEELIEGGNAPLGTFSARIAACFVLGLITEKEHDDLRLIRRIRNAFAHESDTTFNSPDVIKCCMELSQQASPEANEPLIAAKKFHIAAVAIIMNLSNRPDYVEKQKRRLGTWPQMKV